MHFDPYQIAQWTPETATLVTPRLVDSILIAHPALGSEGTPSSVYARTMEETVQNGGLINGGGYSVATWFDLFSRALLLYEAELEDQADIADMMSSTETNFELIACDFATLPRCLNGAGKVGVFKTPMAMVNALKIFQRLSPGKAFSIALHIQCALVSPAILAAVISELNLR